MIVIDTSVAVKWVVPEDGANIEAGTSAALDLLSQPLIAPDCIMGEFANALFKKVQRGEIGAEQARESVVILPDIVDFLPTAPLVVPAMELALRLPHPVHDCIFLIAAMQLDLRLVTADAKFHASCHQSGKAFPIDLLGAEA